MCKLYRNEDACLYVSTQSVSQSNVRLNIPSGPIAGDISNHFLLGYSLLDVHYSASSSEDRKRCY